MSANAPAALLAGAGNFRAVKPYRAADGRHLKPGTIYRSGELSRLTEADLAIIDSLNIRLICDLRTAREQAEYASLWPPSATPARLDLPDRDESDAGPHKIFALILQHPGEQGGLLAMDHLYRRKPRAFAASLTLLFETILQGDAIPLLLHCHAGKDRTGFMVAMLLTAIGIARDDVIEDYITTAHYFPIEREARALAGWARRSFGHEIDPASARPMVDAKRDYIEAAFAEITKTWGNTETYLRDAVGLTAPAQAKLAGLLLQ